MGVPQTEEIRLQLYAVAADPAGDPAAGALWIAAEEYPEMDPAAYLSYLETLAERVAAHPGPSDSGEAGQRALVRELYEVEGYRGNSADYYDPRNSHLNQVIDRRCGIPITLAILYLSLGRRLGRDTAGVNTPGHFLVRDEERFIDPFAGGRTMPPAEILAILEKSGARNPAESLRQLSENPTDTRTILARVLVNLRTNHLRRKELDRALSDVDRLVHLDGDNPAWVRERGALFQHLQCPAAAKADFETYLTRVPDDPEAEIIRQTIEALGRDLPPVQ